jgi:hypothetical protein
MRVAVYALVLATLASSVATAQSAKENFSYSAPSGMFSEGTAKWQMYRFMHEDAERTAAMRRGVDPTATGSIQGSATTSESVRRPGEAGRRRAR